MPVRLGRRATLGLVLRAAIACVLAVGLSACTSEQLAPSRGEDTASPPAPAPTTAPSGPFASSTPTRPELTGSYDEYVALGDSYTAGPLIAPEDPNGEVCARSLANYPHLLATRLEVETLHDVSCSGASTAALTRPQTGLFGTNAPQLGALAESTDLVTLGIGGNDFAVFGRLVTGCARARSTDPEGAPCAERLAGVTDDFGQTRERVADALEEIRRRSPDAEVLLVGYPQLAPTQGACPDVLPFADGDYAFARHVERELNQALQEAARSADVKFVDVAGPSAGHDACAGDEAWVNGSRTVEGRALSYHPFERGMTAVADLVYAELG